MHARVKLHIYVEGYFLPIGKHKCREEATQFWSTTSKNACTWKYTCHRGTNYMNMT